MHRLNRIVPLVVAFALVLLFGSAPASAQDQDPATDWSRVQSAGKILVGTSADYPPFEYYDSNFQLDGFDIALAKELGKRMGVEVEFNDFAFSGLLDALRLGQVDAAISAISVTPDRQQLVDFTNLYYIGNDAALVRAGGTESIKSATDFAGMKVGVQHGTTYQAWAQQNLVDAGVIPQENLIPYEDNNVMVRNLRNGTIDVALMGQLTATNFDQRAPDLRIAGQGVNQQQMAIAANKGSSLIEQLNQALLAAQADGTYARLVDQYLNVSAEEVTPDEDTSQVINLPVITDTRVAPACIYGMAWVEDLNLDDANMTNPPVMQPGQSFAKSWRVRNSGTCAWEPDFALVYVNGNQPGAQMGGQPLPMGRTIQPNETADLTVSLVAPQLPGVYQGFWQMRDNTGRLFGEVVWVGIQIPNPNPPTPTPAPAQPTAVPTPTPAPAGLNPNLRADASVINAGQCTTIRWDVDNVNAVYFIDGNNSQGVGGHDSRTVCPTSTTTYTLQVIQRDNSAVNFPITITVNGQPPPRSGPVITQFTSTSNSIKTGECVRFNWKTEHADGVNLFRSSTQIVANGSKEGSFNDCPPDGNYQYRLEAFGNGQTAQTISVTVGGRHRDE